MHVYWEGKCKDSASAHCGTVHARWPPLLLPAGVVWRVWCVVLDDVQHDDIQCTCTQPYICTYVHTHVHTHTDALHAPSCLWKTSMWLGSCMLERFGKLH